MTDSLKVMLNTDQTQKQAHARAALTPECLSATVLVSCTSFPDPPINEMVEELKRQTLAVNNGDMRRPETMLVSQAHALDGLFAQLSTQAMTATHLDRMETLLRLALKAQNQARATLQTLAELKAPKQIAFVKQANIGNQLQVNNGTSKQPARTRKTKKTQNELLEVKDGERLDTRATSAAGGVDQTMATMGEKQRAAKP